MGEVSVSLWTGQSSDAELLAGVRAGESAAFGVLFERHAGAARRVASMYTSTPSDIDDIVSESFARVLKILQEGGGPDLAFRAYLFTVVRRTGLDLIRKAKRIGPEDVADCDAQIGYSAASDEPTLTDFEHSIVADAFKSLPERWQVVLWYTEIEKKAPAEVAPLLGLSANGVAALAYRAREALRQAYLQQHLATTEDVSCLSVSENLSGYVRGGLTKREHAKVEAHVKQCTRCEALVAELEDVNRGLRVVIAPLVLGVIGLGALETSLPIGGVGAVSVGVGASSGGAGVGSAGASGATASVASGVSAGVVSGVGGAVATTVGTTAISSVGTQVTTATTTVLANTVGAGATILSTTAATIGVAALAVAGAGLFGGLSAYHDGGSDAADSSSSIVDLIMLPDNGLPTHGLPLVPGVLEPDVIEPAVIAPPAPVVEPQEPQPIPQTVPVEDVTPPVEDVTPPVEDVTPPVEDVTPPVEDVTPPVEDVTPPVEDVTPPVEDPTDPGTDPGTNPGTNPNPIIDPEPEPNPGTIIDPEPEPNPNPIIDPEPEPNPGTDPVVITGSRFTVTFGNDGTFYLDLPAPVVSVLVSNPSGQGSTPVTLVLDLPVGAAYVATTDKHGSPVLESEDPGWNCTVSSDLNISTCETLGSLPGETSIPLSLHVAVTEPLAVDAVTTVTASTVHEAPPPVDVPTVVRPEGPVDGDEGTGDTGTGAGDE